MPKQMYRAQLKSLYISLFMSILCLAYADFGQQLVETPFIFAGMIIAIIAAYYLEGKAYLSIQQSNTVAFIVVIAGLAWLLITFNINTDDDISVAATRTVLGRAGPIMALLMLAKLFRPKEASDQWMLHLLAFVMVLLACAITMQSRYRDTTLFPVLLLGYLASLTWALRWFFLGRELEFDTLGERILPSPKVGWASITFWFLTGLLLTLFFLMSIPQFSEFSGMGTNKQEVGFNSVADLNNSGELDVSNEQVLDMQIVSKNRLPVNFMLAEDFRLRGSVCSVYTNDGVWVPAEKGPRGIKVTNDQMNNFTDVRLVIDLDLRKVKDNGGTRNTSAGIRDENEYKGPLFLADPPSYNRDSYKISFDNLTGRADILTSATMSSDYDAQVKTEISNRRLTYSQPFKLSMAQPASEWTQNIRIDLDREAERKEYLSSIQLSIEKLKQLPERIRRSDKIRQVALKALADAKLTEASPHDQISKAFESYLMKSEYTYSLERKRQDQDMDPTEDFLINVKEGHCQRYASALALMLRSVKVPCRLVIGFRGLERSLGGVCIVRQSNAHAWVEAMTQTNLKNLTPDDSRVTMKWLVLDPSPRENIAADVSAMAQRMNFIRFLWEFFILDLSGQGQKARLLAMVRQSWLGDLLIYWQRLPTWLAWTTLIGTLAIFGGLIFLLVWYVRWKLRKYRELQMIVGQQSHPLYRALIQLFFRLGWKKKVWETPREFADSSEAKMAKEESTKMVAQVPNRVVDAYYDARFGGKSIAQERENELQQEIKRMGESFKS